MHIDDMTVNFKKLGEALIATQQIRGDEIGASPAKNNICSYIDDANKAQRESLLCIQRMIAHVGGGPEPEKIQPGEKDAECLLEAAEKCSAAAKDIMRMLHVLETVLG